MIDSAESLHSLITFINRQVNDNGLLSPLVVPGLHFLVSGRWCVLPYPALILLSCGLCLKYQTIKQLFKTVCSLYSDNWQRLIGSHFLSMEFRGEEKLDLGFYLIGVNWSVTQKVCNWYHFLTLHFPAVSRKPERFLFYLLGFVTLHSSPSCPPPHTMTHCHLGLLISFGGARTPD